jgi:hypothetical protein
MSDDPRSEVEKQFEDAYERAVMSTVAHALTLRKEGFDDNTIAEIFAEAADRGLKAYPQKAHLGDRLRLSKAYAEVHRWRLSARPLAGPGSRNPRAGTAAVNQTRPLVINFPVTPEK